MSKIDPNAPQIPFTQEAYDDMKAEFHRLTELRKEVVIRLTAAREMGDLSENGAYKYAKIELGDIGRKLRELRYLLHYGHVVQTKTGDTVEFGRTVTLKSKNRELTFVLVSQHESDPRAGKLSYESPIGKAIRGKKVGDSVVVEAPSGLVEYTVATIH